MAGDGEMTKQRTVEITEEGTPGSDLENEYRLERLGSPLGLSTNRVHSMIGSCTVCRE